MKRQLTEEETKLMDKALIQTNEELEYKEKVELAKTQLALDIADIEYRKQLREMQVNVKRIKAEVEFLNKKIEIMEDQRINGVKIKEKKEEPEKEIVEEQNE